MRVELRIRSRRIAHTAPMSSTTLGAAGSVASRWQELQGSESWDGLLEPIDADLRTSLISYGELAGAAYGGLNSEKRSSHAGSCLYSHEKLLAATGVSHPEYYTVTKFLYATCDLGHVPFFAWSVAKAFIVQPVVKVVPVAPQQQAAAAVEAETEPWWKKCLEWLEWWKWVKTDWIGYVAVATDEGAVALGRRDIVVAWRGTVEGLEMIKDIVFMGMSPGPLLGPSSASVHRRFRCAKVHGAKVHGGFLSVYTAKPKPEDSKHKDEIKLSAREQALKEVGRLMEVHKDEVTSITVTGHSLGASLATLNAVDMVANGVNVPPGSSRQPPCPVTAILFACPKVGNCRFRAAFASFADLRAIHVKNDPDVIPKMPPLYVDAATVTLHIDTRKSPHLRVCNVKLMNPFADLLLYHSLECYLHCIAGYRGAADGGFELVVHRDVALVNKSADALVDTYEVPAYWWVASNKFMVKNDEGHWVLEDHEKKKQLSADDRHDGCV